MTGNPKQLLAKLECLSRWTNEEIKEAFGKQEKTTKDCLKKGDKNK